jgi:hypothetical protein
MEVKEEIFRIDGKGRTGKFPLLLYPGKKIQEGMCPSFAA